MGVEAPRLKVGYKLCPSQGQHIRLKRDIYHPFFIVPLEEEDTQDAHGNKRPRRPCCHNMSPGLKSMTHVEILWFIVSWKELQWRPLCLYIYNSTACIGMLLSTLLVHVCNLLMLHFFQICLTILASAVEPNAWEPCDSIKTQFNQNKVSRAKIADSSFKYLSNLFYFPLKCYIYYINIYL